ncbi:MAG: hypothetical protein AAF389_14105 [Gemmatimonadota bacterium]
MGRQRQGARGVGQMALLTLLMTACAGADAPPTPVESLWQDDLPVGPHPVGFRTEVGERQAETGPRTVTLAVWYPAVDGAAGTPVRIADYFDLVVAEGLLTETDGLTRPAGFTAAMTGSGTALSDSAATAALDLVGVASSEAPEADGAAPLILWSSRHATVLAQAPMAEALASHGYVVATAWSSDPPIAFLWEDHPPEEKVETIERHADDLRWAIDRLRAAPNVDASAVVVVAWSYGGQTAGRIQETEPAVRGTIALDANILPSRPEESLRLTRPLVQVVGGDRGRRGLEGADTLGQSLAVLRFPELAHGSFNALEGYLPERLGTSSVYSWSQQGPAAHLGYRDLVRVVLGAADLLTSSDSVDLSGWASRLPAALETPLDVSLHPND